MDYSNDNILKHVDSPVFHLVGSAADELGRECYVVGGYVRDIILGRQSTDIDFVTVGSGIEVAKAVAAKFGRKHCSLSVFKTYGTAQVKHHGLELEFVGARRESYHRESRNPIVKTAPLTMTRSAATSPSTQWPCRSMPAATESCSTRLTG